MFQFSLFCDIKEGLKHFLLFMSPLCVLATSLPIAFGFSALPSSCVGERWVFQLYVEFGHQG